MNIDIVGDRKLHVQCLMSGSSSESCGFSKVYDQTRLERVECGFDLELKLENFYGISWSSLPAQAKQGPARHAGAFHT